MKMRFNIVRLYSMTAVVCCILLCVACVDAKKVPKCSVCQDIVKNFQKGLANTAKSNYGGGNTKWEEKSLGSYAFSEVRLVEIVEHLCDEASKESTVDSKIESRLDSMECHSMLEEYEEMIEAFWFKEYGKKKKTELHQYLCIDNMKACCPTHTFGKLCRPCPGGVDRPCSGNGECEGAGTRDGSGKCKCNSGYKGDLCKECKDGFYEESNNETHVVCKVCHISCKDLCDEAGPKGCDECKPGWLNNEELGCQDINECEEDPCEPNQYCTNTQGSHTCFTCDLACATCNGSSSAQCKECATGYKINTETGICADINECEDSSLCNEFKTICENTPGSYFCGCDQGFSMSPEGVCVMDTEATKAAKPGNKLNLADQIKSQLNKELNKVKGRSGGNEWFKMADVSSLGVHFLVLALYGLSCRFAESSTLIKTALSALLVIHVLYFAINSK